MVGRKTWPDLCLLVSMQYVKTPSPGGVGMAAPGKTNCTASVYHKHKPSCKYHSGITRFLSRSFQWPFWAAPYHMGGEQLTPREEPMSWFLPPARGRWNNHGEELQMIKSCPKSKLPCKWKVIRTRPVQPHVLCKAAKSSCVTAEQNFIPGFSWSTTMTDTNAPAGRRPIINQDSL